MTSEALLFHLSDDLILKILLKLDGDPRHWAYLACACTKLSALIRSVCYKHRCVHSIPAVLADLLHHPITAAPHPLDPPPHWWASLHKLAVCCPGLLHAGVLPEHPVPAPPPPSADFSSSSWTFPDGLYDPSESPIPATTLPPAAGDTQAKKRRRRPAHGPAGAHLARRAWNLSREEGNKLLASRFRGDALYICGWPGCVHGEEKRKYMLFRGVFKNFERSGVWRAIKDGNRSKLRLGCAFCDCGETYDLLSAFCLRRVFGCYHDDGEPVVRAYVCENGHVSGAWTDRPMYT